MTETRFPTIRNVGLSGLLVTFSDELTDSANGAALAFRAAIDITGIEGIIETTTSLTSTFISFDPSTISPKEIRFRAIELLETNDWLSAPLPTPHNLWHIPACFGGEFGPQLTEAAELTGVDEETAIREIENTTLRVMTIGFAPGQPYLGSLPANWDIPRQTGLTKSVPKGAITVAIQQITTFTNSTPTGWRHIGQMAFENFRPDAEEPFFMKPGDEVQFHVVANDVMHALLHDENVTLNTLSGQLTGNGGATVEEIL